MKIIIKRNLFDNARKKFRLSEEKKLNDIGENFLKVVYEFYLENHGEEFYNKLIKLEEIGKLKYAVADLKDDKLFNLFKRLVFFNINVKRWYFVTVSHSGREVLVGMSSSGNFNNPGKKIFNLSIDKNFIFEDVFRELIVDQMNYVINSGVIPTFNLIGMEKYINI